jgi:hypothetical protein
MIETGFSRLSALMFILNRQLLVCDPAATSEEDCPSLTRQTTPSGGLPHRNVANVRPASTYERSESERQREESDIESEGEISERTKER